MRKGGWMARLRSGTSCRREQKHSQWEFPDWIPVAHKWTCLSDRYHGSREGAGTKKNGAGPSSVWSEPEMGEAVLPHPSVYLLWAFGSLGFGCGERGQQQGCVEAGMVLGLGWGGWVRVGRSPLTCACTARLPRTCRQRRGLPCSPSSARASRTMVPCTG